MIEDYKKQERTSSSRRHRKGAIRVALGIAALGAVIALVYRSDPVDLIPVASAKTTAQEVLSTPLSLPTPGPSPATAVSAPPAKPAAKPRVDHQAPAVALVAPKPAITQEVTAAAIEQKTSSPETLAESVDPAQSVVTAEDSNTATSTAPAMTDADESAATVTVQSEPDFKWFEHEIKSGDSLARIFDAMDLEAAVLHGIVSSGKQAKTLSRLRPGQTLRFRIGDDGELEQLVWQQDAVRSLRISVGDDEIRTEQFDKELETRIASASGIITSSLFAAGQDAGLSDGKIMELAEIFGWDIDFALEIRAGDHFRVLYEQQFLDGQELRDGPILAAEFTNRGNTHTAVRYESTDGEIAYYDSEGHNKRRAFIRTPIKFARVSSRYNPKRWHPVLKRWRAHKGVDYAAPIGTPIRATGDGRVTFRGSKRGYGKTVILEHAGKYTTLYAHMSKYSKRARTGKRVKQGQVIGYVGKTGLATGPHLHYEFRVNGVHKDPLKVKLPKTLSLPKQELDRFQRTTAPLLADLRAIPSETLVASNTTED